MTTFASLFTGGGGADIGAMQAGLTPVWGVEYVSEIAAIAERNLGHPVTVADILTLDPFDFEPVDVLHASPPCPNFSVAKAGAEETENDIALGRKVAEFVEALCPSLFTLENVYGYRKAKSFRLIVKALRRLGYHVRWWHLNSADYGVAQTRRRLILVAAQDFTPRRPETTHRDPATVVDGQLSLFGDALPPWVGWYAAIEDLIPTLPDSAFAPWQLARLPAELSSILIGGANTSDELAAPGVGVSELQEPTRTVAGNSDRWRAFVCSAAGTGFEPVNGGRPAPTVVSSNKTMAPKAFIVDDGNTKNGLIKDQEQPMATVRTMGTGGTFGRAYTEGRTVQMTPRALARFQSIPDWYALPDSKTLACRILGNAVPPLLMQRVLEAQR